LIPIVVALCTGCSGGASSATASDTSPSTTSSDAAAPDGAGGPLTADDTDLVESYCTAITNCKIPGHSTDVGWGQCVQQTLSQLQSTQGFTQARAAGVIGRCGMATHDDCSAINDCVAGPVKSGRCIGTGYAYCDEGLLVDCSGSDAPGHSLAPGEGRPINCASQYQQGLSAGPKCVSISSGSSTGTATCAAGKCDPIAPGWTCQGDLLVECQDGLLTQQDCAAAGQVCSGGGCTASP
jgi:hypothetical protein